MAAHVYNPNLGGWELEDCGSLFPVELQVQYPKEQDGNLRNTACNLWSQCVCTQVYMWMDRHKQTEERKGILKKEMSFFSSAKPYCCSHQRLCAGGLVVNVSCGCIISQTHTISRSTSLPFVAASGLPAPAGRAGREVGSEKCSFPPLSCPS